MDDPKRPLYAPAAHSINSTARTGILGYHFVTSDDGRLVRLAMRSGPPLAI
jgi:hypothetical protein